MTQDKHTMDHSEATRKARQMLGPDAQAVYNPSLSRPYRIIRHKWMFESTLGTGNTWEEALGEVARFLFPGAR